MTFTGENFMVPPLDISQLSREFPKSTQNKSNEENLKIPLASHAKNSSLLNTGRYWYQMCTEQSNGSHGTNMIYKYSLVILYKFQDPVYLSS